MCQPNYVYRTKLIHLKNFRKFEAQNRASQKDENRARPQSHPPHTRFDFFAKFHSRKNKNRTSLRILSSIIYCRRDGNKFSAFDIRDRDEFIRRFRAESVCTAYK